MRAWYVIVVALLLCLGSDVHAVHKGGEHWKKGMALYRSYEFAKSIPWLLKSIAHPPARWKSSQRAYAIVVLSLCYYNLAKTKKAISSFRKALALDREVQLPPLVPIHVKARYESHRVEWKKKNAKPKALFRFPKSRPRIEKPPRRRGKARRAIVRERPIPKPSKPFPYTGPLLLLAGALALGGGAVGLLIASQQTYVEVEQIQRLEPNSAMEKKHTYERSYAMGVGSILATIVAGGLATAGGAWLIYQLQHSPTPPVPNVATKKSRASFKWRFPQ